MDMIEGKNNIRFHNMAFRSYAPLFYRPDRNLVMPVGFKAFIISSHMYLPSFIQSLHVRGPISASNSKIYLHQSTSNGFHHCQIGSDNQRASSARWSKEAKQVYIPASVSSLALLFALNKHSHTQSHRPL